MHCMGTSLRHIGYLHFGPGSAAALVQIWRCDPMVGSRTLETEGVVGQECHQAPHGYDRLCPDSPANGLSPSWTEVCMESP